MPLGPTGNKVKGEMKNRYGAEKGERVFYAKQNKDRTFKKAMHKGARGGRSASRRR